MNTVVIRALRGSSAIFVYAVFEEAGGVPVESPGYHVQARNAEGFPPNGSPRKNLISRVAKRMHCILIRSKSRG